MPTTKKITFSFDSVFLANPNTLKGFAPKNKEIGECFATIVSFLNEQKLNLTQTLIAKLLAQDACDASGKIKPISDWNPDRYKELKRGASYDFSSGKDGELPITEENHEKIRQQLLAPFVAKGIAPEGQAFVLALFHQQIGFFANGLKGFAMLNMITFIKPESQEKYNGLEYKYSLLASMTLRLVSLLYTLNLQGQAMKSFVKQIVFLT